MAVRYNIIVMNNRSYNITLNMYNSGERNKGWQFGENLRTQCSGWFPLAYTEPVLEDSVFS